MVGNYLNPTFCFRVHDSPQKKKKKGWCIYYIYSVTFSSQEGTNKSYKQTSYGLISIYIILDIDI